VPVLYDLSSNEDCAAKDTMVAPSLFVILLLVSLCLTRPTLFGQDFNFVGGLGVIATTFAYLLTRSGARVMVARSSAALNTAIALLVFWSYALGSSVFFGNSILDFLLKACAAGIGVTICFLLLSLSGNLVDRTFSAFARLNSGVGYSIAITSCLLPIVGYSSLHVYNYAIGGYSDADGITGDVLFPFSVVYANLEQYGFYRFCGIYREAGIAQAYFVWSAIYLMYSRAPRLWVVGSLLGAVLCGSTAVVFSFAGVAVVHFGSRSRQRPRELWILALLLGILTLIAFFAPGLGLLDKSVYYSTSLSDRQGAMAMALPGGETWRWLFGHGMFYNKEIANAGINAISSIFQIGVFGFALYVATFFAGVFGTRSYVDACRYVTLISPLLVTSLFFQPVIDAPLVIASLFCFPPPMRKS